MIHYAKIEKPRVNDKGISDPVNIFTSDGEIVVAWWDEVQKCWCCPDRFNPKTEKCEAFGKGVQFWTEIKFPKGWFYDEGIYGGEEGFICNSCECRDSCDGIEYMSKDQCEKKRGLQ